MTVADAREQWQQDEQGLIDRYIAQDRHGRGPEEATVAGTGVAVWALIGYLQGVGQDMGRVAADYDFPIEAVRAVVAYYRRHPEIIDARLARNDARIEAAIRAAS